MKLQHYVIKYQTSHLYFKLAFHVREDVLLASLSLPANETRKPL
jgi:hypothetical protein